MSVICKHINSLMYVYVTRVPSVVRCHVRSYRSRTLITFTASPTDSSCSLQHKMSYEHTQTHTGDEYNSTVVTTNMIVASGSPLRDFTLNLTPLWSYLCSSAPANIQCRAQSVDSVTEALWPPKLCGRLLAWTHRETPMVEHVLHRHLLQLFGSIQQPGGAA